MLVNSVVKIPIQFWHDNKDNNDNDNNDNNDKNIIMMIMIMFAGMAKKDKRLVWLNLGGEEKG